MSSSPYQTLVEIYVFFLASVIVVNVVALVARRLVGGRRKVVR